MAETLIKQFKNVLKYAGQQWIYSLVGGYFFLSLLLFSFCSVDIGIPCLIKWATGFACPGCGLTHAFAHMLKFEFASAWSHNKFSFVVLPFGIYFIWQDYKKYLKQKLINE